MFRLPALLLGASLAVAVGVLVRQTGNADFGAGADSAAAIGGPFALIDQHGRTRTDRDFRGRWMLVYFGYTHCPDACPTTLSRIADALRALGPRGRNIVPVFVSVDPARDTPAVLKTYLAAFGPEFVGLTGTTSGIASMAHAWRVYFVRRSLSGGGYAVDHADTLYLMAPDGRFDSLIDAQEPAAQMKQQLAAKL